MQKVENARLQEELWEGTLAPGLRLIILPRPGFTKKYATFAARYGSIDSHFRIQGGEWVSVPDGIAHFLEHQLFAQEYGDAFERFSAFGASANAFTSFTSTTYLFSATDRFEEAFDLLLDFVQTPYFTDAGTEKEKGIIIQEIRMYQDHPGWRLGQNLRESLYVKHPFRIDIAGSPESVSSITTEQLVSCYRTFYHPSNMVVSVVGDVDPQRVAEQVEASLSRRGYGEQPPIERFYPEEPDEVVDRSREERMSVARPMLEIGFKDPAASDDGTDWLRRDLAASILLEIAFGRGSDFYSRWYNEGIIDESFHTSYYGETGFGLTTVGGETEQPDRLYRAVLDEVERLHREGLSEADFERVKRKAAGESLAGFNSLETLSYMANAAHFHGCGLFDYFEVLNGLSLDDVRDRLNAGLRPDLHALSLVRPR